VLEAARTFHLLSDDSGDDTRTELEPSIAVTTEHFCDIQLAANGQVYAYLSHQILMCVEDVESEQYRTPQTRLTERNMEPPAGL